MKVLITGGAGFIGSNVARRLLKENYEITILDNFSEQIHGDNKSLVSDLQGKVRLIVGDVCDKTVFLGALAGQEVVVHLAAETGTGQSMYEVERYEEVNVKGTAILMDFLVNDKTSQVKKIVVASSRAIYGEGKYNCAQHGIIYPENRRTADMKEGRFEPLCPICGRDCQMVPTDEMSRINPSSFYGLTKQMQEQMALLFGRTLGIDAFALRFQNVYGPGQSLKNPYTGILAIFSNLARANEPIYVFEDGQESRDFVYIDDVADAVWRCVSPETHGVEVLNVGSGQPTTVLEVVQETIKFFNSSSEASVTGAFRDGDIRHNIADLTKATDVIGFVPQWTFVQGIQLFLSWANSQSVVAGQYEESLKEMRDRGLMHG